MAKCRSLGTLPGPIIFELLEYTKVNAVDIRNKRFFRGEKAITTALLRKLDNGFRVSDSLQEGAGRMPALQKAIRHKIARGLLLNGEIGA
jgi:hypothetical protein